MRFKCGVCEDLDLCARCEPPVPHDDTHALLKIRPREAVPAAGLCCCLRDAVSAQALVVASASAQAAATAEAGAVQGGSGWSRWPSTPPWLPSRSPSAGSP